MPEHAFGFLRTGYAAPMAWFLFLVIAVMTLLQFRLALLGITGAFD